MKIGRLQIHVNLYWSFKKYRIETPVRLLSTQHHAQTSTQMWSKSITKVWKYGLLEFEWTGPDNGCMFLEVDRYPWPG